VGVGVWGASWRLHVGVGFGVLGGGVGGGVVSSGWWWWRWLAER